MDFSGFQADSHQQDNPAGVTRLWKVLASSFTEEFPVKSGVVAGEITTDPLACLPALYELAEYVLPVRTAGWDDELTGEHGFMFYIHALDFETAGFDKESLAEFMKDMNAPAVYFLETFDDKIAVAGWSKKGMLPVSNGKSGKVGGDHRGRILKAANNGYRWPVLPLADDLIADFLVRAKGFTAISRSATTTGGVTQIAFTVDDVVALEAGMTVQFGPEGEDTVLAWGVIGSIVGLVVTVPVTYKSIGYVYAAGVHEVKAVSAVPAAYYRVAYYSGADKTLATSGHSNPAVLQVEHLNGLALNNYVKCDPTGSGGGIPIGLAYGQITAISSITNEVTVTVSSMTGGNTSITSANWKIEKIDALP